MREGQSARLSALAEKPADNAPLWVKHAYELRTKNLLSEQRIADMLDKPLHQVRKALHPKRTKATNSAYEKRNRKSLSQRQIAKRLERTPRCHRCGGPLTNMSKSKEPTCRGCQADMAYERNLEIQQLWMIDYSLGEIAEMVGMRRESVAATISRLRTEGWDFPYRRGYGLEDEYRRRVA